MNMKNVLEVPVRPLVSADEFRKYALEIREREDRDLDLICQLYNALLSANTKLEVDFMAISKVRPQKELALLNTKISGLDEADLPGPLLSRDSNKTSSELTNHFTLHLLLLHADLNAVFDETVGAGFIKTPTVQVGVPFGRGARRRFAGGDLPLLTNSRPQVIDVDPFCVSVDGVTLEVHPYQEVSKTHCSAKISALKDRFFPKPNGMNFNRRVFADENGRITIEWNNFVEDEKVHLENSLHIPLRLTEPVTEKRTCYPFVLDSIDELKDLVQRSTDHLS